MPPGSLLLETCHRVEAYSVGASPCPGTSAMAPGGGRCLSGIDVVRHVVRLAVGLESTVIAEDQILHQLRRMLAGARAQGSVEAPLDRLVDVALRGGRRARTWLPPSSRGLAELALRRVAGAHALDRPVLVVGAGEMGRRAVGALRRRGATVMVTSRTPERALAVASDQGASVVPFDPGAATLRSVAGVFVALAGDWTLSEPSRQALIEAGWIVDLSAPPAVDSDILAGFAGRALTIDDLAGQGESELSDRLRARLHALVEDCVAEYARWSALQPQRELALALAERASEAQATELSALWRRMPELDPVQRQQVERMARHLAERLLREPLEQLAGDSDGDRARAARELFRL
jgi:glutamyl-tRNA reductase